MVYVLLAEGFEEVEALTPVDLLRRAGVETRLVGVTGETVCGALDFACALITALISREKADEIALSVVYHAAN